MKTSLLALIAVVALATIGMADAQAKKMGGGGNLGRQSSNAPMQRDGSGATGAAPRQAQPAQPAAPAAAPAAAPRPGAAPQASSRSRWMGPLAGLAAGLGLAALPSARNDVSGRGGWTVGGAVGTEAVQRGPGLGHRPRGLGRPSRYRHSGEGRNPAARASANLLGGA